MTMRNFSERPRGDEDGGTVLSQHVCDGERWVES
jgi:hypothetical protein